MTPGTRVRFNINSVWPERVGCDGVVVAPKVPGQYPDDPRDKNRVLVLLDDDPLMCHCTSGTCMRAHRDWWTCATDRASLDVLAGLA